MQSLFESGQNPHAPLAERMRPQTLAEFEEQSELVGKGKALRKAIESDLLGSIILYGPPGSGKTTLAEIISHQTQSHFVRLNAVMAGVADLRQVVEEARQSQNLYQEKTLLFIDEIHRFNKNQQDALLPFVENGLLVLIGSTTENPLFAVNRPLLSRSRIYQLQALSPPALVRILQRALQDQTRGLGSYQTQIEPGILQYLAEAANGDARSALNNLEALVLTTLPDVNGIRQPSLQQVREICQNRNIPFARASEHYDVMSAFIKSMRGSDPQATLYWLARLIQAGEDPRVICRRILIHAAEDVGLADPLVLTVAAAAAQAVEMVGWPEARIIVAEAALSVAVAPKSNSVEQGIDAALKAVREEAILAPPPHLQDSSSQKLSRLTAQPPSAAYQYPHNFPGHFVRQQYLPDNMQGRTFYQPSENGKEKLIKEKLQKLGQLPDQN